MVGLIAATGAFILQFAGGKVLGDSADKFFDFLAKRKLDPNHHLEKAIVEAHFCALEDVINFAVKHHGLPSLGVAAPNNARGEIARQQKAFKDAPNTKKTFDARFDAAMTEDGLSAVATALATDWRNVVPKTFTDKEGMLALPPAHVDAAVAELKSLAQWFDDEWAIMEEAARDPNTGWANCFRLRLHATLKANDSPAREYLHTHWLRDIHGGVDKLLEGMEGLHNKVDNLAEEQRVGFARLSAQIDSTVQRGHYLNDVGHNYPKYLAKKLIAEDLPEDKWEQAITAALDAYIHGKAQLATLHNLPAELQEKRAQALALFDEARLEEAAELLDQLIAAQADHYQQAVHDRAQLFLDRAVVAQAAQDFNGMLSAYEAAAQTIAPEDPEAAWRHLITGADAGYDRALIFGERTLMEGAVRLFRTARALVSDPAFPDQAAAGLDEAWAMTQNNLGTALKVLGERGDADALAQAVTAYRAALTIYTRDEMPADWAMTQNNLGNALSEMGKRGDGAALAQAVSAFREALEVHTRDEMPADWAVIQNNLGNALSEMGERGDGAALAQAVSAFREALEVHTRDEMPVQWAMTQNNLGNALLVMGERGDQAALAQAVTAFEEALKVYTHDTMPADWAMTQNNLGIALSTLGERGDADALAQAVTAFEAALKVCDAMPAQWAMTQNNLGNALQVMGEHGRANICFCNALGAYKSMASTHHVAQIETTMRRRGLDPDKCAGSALSLASRQDRAKQ